MDRSSEKSNQNRERTDRNLRAERLKTDGARDKSEDLIEARARLVVGTAREAADQVLSTARTQEDKKLGRAEARAGAIRLVQEERVRADRALLIERSDADHHLESERAALNGAALELLRQERKETDGALVLERSSQVAQARAAEHTVEGLRVRLFEQSLKTENALETRESFLSMASHELRTPLTVLQLQIQGLLHQARATMGSVNPGMVRQLTLCERNVQGLERLFGRMLEVSHLSPGILDLEAEPVNLSELTCAVASRIDSLALSAGCKIFFDIEPRVLGTWHRRRLEQIVTNLLLNAFKYGAGKPVTVRLKAFESSAHLSVEDRGIGIAVDDHQRIFFRFERVSSGAHYGGFGLGLWIVQQAVHALRGQVSVYSELGSGATFTVDLPIRGCAKTPGDEVMNGSMPADTSPH